MAFAYCPDCAGRIYLGRRPWVGQLGGCDRCDAELEVIEVNPPRLDWTENLLDENWEKDWQFELQNA
jgi:lysine biosynthesis protein LysW